MIGAQQLPGGHYPAGSGRFVDVQYPDYTSMVTAVAALARHRNGVSVATNETQVAGGGKQAGVWKGVDSVQLFNNAGGDMFQVAFDAALPLHIGTTKGASFANSGLNDSACYRVIFVMANGNAAPLDNLHDYGAQIVTANGTTGLILKDANTGIGIHYAGINSVELIIRGPNGLIRTPFALDTTVFHAFEFRFTSATDVAEARMKFFIDGKQQTLPAASSSWAAGTNLPGGGPALRTGYRPCIVNYAGVACSAFYQLVKLIAAPTEADTL